MHSSILILLIIIIFSFTRHPNDLIGRGLCLIDFGRSIDVRSFPNGTQFIGASDTDSFQCVQMINNTPWTYQVSSIYVCLSILIYPSLFECMRTLELHIYMYMYIYVYIYNIQCIYI